MSTLQEIRQVCGRGVPVLGDDIDTDRIIPARFMKCVTFDGLGEFAFYDERFIQDGEPKEDFALNKPQFAGATVLVSGENFGCGSSREHAPQSLYYYGFRAIVAVSFAEIFFGNASQIGIACLSVSREDAERLAEVISSEPTIEVAVDVEKLQVRAGDLVLQASMPEGVQQGLIEGKWDPLTELLSAESAVNARTEALPYFEGR